MMLRHPADRIPIFAAGFGALALASCNAAPATDRFDGSGELIALSGGDAGPRASCHTCHGLNGGGDGALAPRIAAMDAGYLVRQLGFFSDGQRRHPQMSWLASRLDSDARMAVARYYAEMPIPEPRAPVTRTARDLRRGQACDVEHAATLYHEGIPERGLASCASCHGADGSGVGPGNPSLEGQSPAYLAEQLRRWLEGERYGDPMGVMQDAASRLREEEIIPLAAYIASGPERSRRPESPAGCP